MLVETVKRVGRRSNVERQGKVMRNDRRYGLRLMKGRVCE
jgi:hypothetical protein